MAYMRQNIGTGGLYPTGRSPFAADLTDSTRAITERMIKRRQEEIALEKNEVVENEKKILEALSYEAVLGASEKMQLKHLENVNNLHDKWADIFGANDGKLSTKQLHELQKDKQEVERQRVDMQTNIKEFELVQKEILSDPYNKKWTKESHEKFGELAKAGKVGDLSVNWLSVLSPKPRDMQSYLTDEYKTFAGNVAKNIDTTGMKVGEDGIVRWNETNQRILDSAFQTFLGLPAGKDVFESYGGGADAIKKMKDEFEFTVGAEVKKEQIYPSIYGAQQKAKGEAEIETDAQIALKRNNIKVDPKYADNIRQANEMSEGMRLADDATLNTLKNRYIPKLGGTPEDVWVQYGKDGFVVRMEKGDKVEKMEFPYVAADDPILKEYKLGAFGDPTSSAKVYAGGKQLPNNIAGAFAPKWKLERPIEPAMPAGLTNLTKMLQEKGKDTKVDGVDIRYVELIAQAISSDDPRSIFTDADVKVKDNDTVIFKGKPYKIKRKTAIGRWLKDNEEISKNKEDLKEAVLQEINRYQEKLKEQAEYVGDAENVSYQVNGVQYSIPADEVDEFLKDYPTAKKL